MEKRSLFASSPRKQSGFTSTVPHHHSRARQKSALPDFQFTSECSTPKFSLSSISLYSDIEDVLRKLDPSFKLFLSNQSPISQILQCVRQTTHFLLEQQKKPVIENTSFKYLKNIVCEHCGKQSNNCKSETALLIQNSDQMKQKVKNFEKQKLIQSEKIKEEKRLLSIYKEKLEGLAERLTKQKQEIINEEVEKKRQKMNMQRIDSLNVQPQSKKFSGMLSSETLTPISVTSDFDFSSLVEELEKHIQIYNEEVAVKVSQLNEKEERLKFRENWVKKQISDIEMVSLALNNSKKDCFDLKQEIFPSIEVQLGLLKQTLEDLNDRKMNLEEILENFEDLVAGNESWAEFHYLRNETQKKYKENCEYSDYLAELQQKLDKYYEEKNQEINENGEKLKKLQENVNLTIEMMEIKEKELMKVGENLKLKEQRLLKYGRSNGDINYDSNSGTIEIPRNPGLGHNRKSLSMVKVLDNKQ